MKKYLYFIFACVLTLSLASCDDDDQYSIESVIIGRAWTGDVGMNADNGAPLFSTFTFGGDGFGEEYQYYSYDGARYMNYRFQWWWEDDFSNNLVLDYGRAGISYMDNVRVTGNQLRGTFHVSDDSPGFNFVLEME
ncbi:hypothetical protein [uncultured Bacteroides sp.]|uniref:hypothetical protein n=1 Tax=uncultured Bacteroides sp. TaxID=162156 RepID=UPI0025F35441|nr:hypothetical protein [uncultured Bacteroides sp.]